ncbi:hypothetical protein ACIBI4_09230 [Streptomyces sp. NPDC050418]|uniref:hypothetical protein n=1 Tax=Streptomyces sp. NPDC050418 TaxID=3365612 RepID=UPI0037A8389A
MRLAWRAAGLTLLTAGLLVSCADGRPAERLGERGGGVSSHGKAVTAGTELATESLRLFQEATSVRLTTAQGVEKTSLLMDREGNCSGTYDGGPMRRAELIVVAGEGAAGSGEGAVYIRYTAQALTEVLTEARRRGPATELRVKPRVDKIRGKYLKMPDPDGAFTSQCNLAVGQKSLPFEAKGLSAGKPTERRGVRVIPLTSKDGPRAALYVAASGPPHLRFATLASGEELQFSSYGKPVTAEAPPAHLVVTLEELGAGTGAGLGGGLLDA